MQWDATWHGGVGCGAWGITETAARVGGGDRDVRVAIRRIGPARSSAPRRLALAPSHFCPWCWVHDSARLVCRVVAHF
ncbi:unnamed protein product [Chondrus crispus]|uniref:Uncharacterized protein n=1 Tax=Chondrus crispus TaxID=2769 RepID=R7Q631_CHOCR|nr:unnamed protein product [Chondrus crispus]CDF33469.1 unnamed protein product [Chondrus crispus]|eukprot:XP_005713272.1 unnamed protein product [Chondrus crispus]